jgi:glutamate-1-semialdehyde 2,1-aminomutase
MAEGAALKSHVLPRLVADERQRFIASHPKSAVMAQAASAHWQGGVPMHWMGDWASPFPIFAASAHHAMITDIDGHTFDDFCLGDTPSMFGHGLEVVANAFKAQALRGTGFMLPTEDAVIVGQLLANRFGLPVWQTANTATDANRAAIRWARAVTGRQKILVFDGCYHGAVDDTFVSLASGKPDLKAGLVGQVHDVSAFAKVIDFNDLAALEAALAPGDVACVLAEPVMTNCGMIAPDPGYIDGLRRLTRQYGTLLLIDETHTISTGPGGATRAYGLEPDIFTLGKAIAGGVPAAVWGVTAELSRRIQAAGQAIGPGYSGIGTTLSGNALSLAAMRVMLEEVMTESAYRHMLAGASRLVAGVEQLIAKRGLAWSAIHIGARVELVFANPAPRNAKQMRSALDHDLLEALHLYLINRGILIAPFHNMMLVSPVTTDAQIDRLIDGINAFAVSLESSPE